MFIDLHFAAKHIAFCGIMRCILPQNGTRFAAKCNSDLPQNEGAFCGKLF